MIMSETESTISYRIDSDSVKSILGTNHPFHENNYYFLSKIIFD